MKRAILKGAGLWMFGNLPGGPHLYRYLTRHLFATQATHVDKLSRAVPPYASVWRGLGCDPEGRTIAILEPGMTLFWPMAAWLLSGRESHMLQLEGAFEDQYVTRSVLGVLGSVAPIAPARRGDIEGLRWAKNSQAVLDRCRAREYSNVSPARLPLGDASVDVCHSGGALEHLRPDTLLACMREIARVLRPGGLASQVFDHRDHLYHADKRIEPMHHLRYPESVYRLLFGHPLLYHNRLQPAEVRALLARAGLEFVAMRRLVLPAARYVSDDEVMNEGRLGCTRPARRFAGASDLDRRTAACHYLFRKPISS